jgi:hypothetical protein
MATPSIDVPEISPTTRSACPVIRSGLVRDAGWRNP